MTTKWLDFKDGLVAKKEELRCAEEGVLVQSVQASMNEKLAQRLEELRTTCNGGLWFSCSVDSRVMKAGLREKLDELRKQTDGSVGGFVYSRTMRMGFVQLSERGLDPWVGKHGMERGKKGWLLKDQVKQAGRPWIWIKTSAPVTREEVLRFVPDV